MPALSRPTKRKKPPRVDYDKGSSESATTDDEVVILPSKNARTSSTLTPTSASAPTRTPQSTSISRRMKARREVSSSGGGLGTGVSRTRTATPPTDNTSQDTTTSASTQSQPQLNKLDTNATPQQGKSSAEPMSTTPTTLGMPAPRRTYSQMRTFLMPLDELDASGQPLAATAPRLALTKSYNDLVLSESQEELQQDTAEKNITFNGETDLRSITEMRVKGESRRFGDDIEYVLEGLEGESIVRVRRASAVEFVGRMCESGFVQRARASDVLGRAWGAIRQSVDETGDRVFDAIAGIFITLVARELQDVPGALQDTSISSIFCLILNRARELDGLEAAASDDSWAVYAEAARKTGLGKVERKQLSALLVLCRKSGIVPSGQVITTRLLVSHGLSLVIPRPIARPLMLTVLSAASAYLRAFDTRLSGYSTGLNVIPPSSAGTVHSLQVMSNLMRGCQVAVDQDHNQDPEESEKQAGGNQEAELAQGVGRQVLLRLAEQCALGCLKILVLLTSDTVTNQSSQLQESEPPPNQIQSMVVRNPLAFHIIARFVAQGAHSEAQSSLFEHACLSLALLLNLVKEGAGGAKQVQRLYIYSACGLGRKCTVECTCRNRKPQLELYTGLYQKLQEMSTLQNDFHSTFILGYLAVLLGLLTVNDESIKDKVYDGLPGESGSNKFEDLAQGIEQFVHAYERVAQATKIKGLTEREGEEDGKENEETMMTSGDAGSGVALDVARRLRDIS
ncbi:hypothetical protein FRC06_000402 [Ceratobasidium sp. 370]|nr:hypothetical protein FRC06_000402 [Ceratobasidium sp. 370]